MRGARCGWLLFPLAGFLGSGCSVQPNAVSYPTSTTWPKSAPTTIDGHSLLVRRGTGEYYEVSSGTRISVSLGSGYGILRSSNPAAVHIAGSSAGTTEVVIAESAGRAILSASAPPSPKCGQNCFLANPVPFLIFIIVN